MTSPSFTNVCKWLPLPDCILDHSILPYDIIHSFPPHSYIRNGYQITVYAKKIFYEVYSNIGDLFLNHLFYDRLILLSFIPDDVHIDGKDNDYAFRHILPVRADAHQVQSVVHDSDDQAPIRVPPRVPDPPVIMVPPSTTAAIAFISALLPWMEARNTVSLPSGLRQIRKRFLR